MSKNPFALGPSGYGPPTNPFYQNEKTPRKQFAQRDRQKIWDDAFGIKIDRTKCPICKKNEISRTHFAIGHKRALAKGGTNTFSNVKPICHQCNSEMGTMSMSEYKRKYHKKAVTTRRKPIKKPTKKILA